VTSVIQIGDSHGDLTTEEDSVRQIYLDSWHGLCVDQR
jgi:hypothetical protein